MYDGGQPVQGVMLLFQVSVDTTRQHGQLEAGLLGAVAYVCLDVGRVNFCWLLQALVGIS
jgi:hypothetical protein